MNQLIADTATWPAGPRLALFFFLPAAMVLQLLRLLADVPLYIEYHVTTVLRARLTTAAPPIVGDVAAAISTAGRTARDATKIVLILGLLVAVISIAVANGQDNRFLVSMGDLIDQFWNNVLRRAGIPA